MSFSSFFDVIEQIKTAWQTDADILAWCSENYDKRPSIFIGMDDNNTPADGFYPIIAALEFKIRGGGSAVRNVFEVVVGCGVLDPEKTTDAENATYTYQGAIKAEVLRHLAFAALVKNNFGKITVKGETGQSSVYPKFVSGMTVEIETINSRRRT